MYDPTRPPPQPGQMSITSMPSSGQGYGRPPYAMRPGNPGLPGNQPRGVMPQPAMMPPQYTNGQMPPRADMLNMWAQYGPQGAPSPFGATPGGMSISPGGYPANPVGDDDRRPDFNRQGFMDATQAWRANSPDRNSFADHDAMRSALMGWRDQRPERSGFMTSPQQPSPRPGIQPGMQPGMQPPSGGFFGRRGR